MQGLHLTADLHDCQCAAQWFTDGDALGASVAYAAWTTQCRLDRGDMLDAALLAAMLPILWPAIAPHASGAAAPARQMIFYPMHQHY